MGNSVTRRVITVGGLLTLLLVASLLLPVLLMVAALVDAVRHLTQQRPAMGLRLVFFGWFYLLGEAWAVTAMAAASLRGPTKSLETTYQLQQKWIDWNFDILRLAFGLTFRVAGLDRIGPTPYLLLARHTSLIDTLLPGRIVAKPSDTRLRYVLKKELLVDPALDIGGHRMPNYFIDRHGDTQRELQGLISLARDLGPGDGVLIFPEGTRYSEDKRNRYISRVPEGHPYRSVIGSYRRVLPPRPAGTLALLDSTDADVVILAHRGLEGFASVGDIWSGNLVGKVIDVELWRIKRSRIPEGRRLREGWLYDTWATVDGWVVGDSPNQMR